MPNKITARHLATVDQRMRQLKALRAELARMLANCEGGCVADCRVLESLGTPKVLAPHQYRRDKMHQYYLAVCLIVAAAQNKSRRESSMMVFGSKYSLRLKFLPLSGLAGLHITASLV